jgi:hypothetical protein
MEAQAGPAVHEQAARTAQEQSPLRPQPTPQADKPPWELSHKAGKPLPKTARGDEHVTEHRTRRAPKPAPGTTDRGGAEFADGTSGRGGTIGFKCRLQGRQGQILVGAHVLGQKRVGHPALRAADTSEADELAMEATVVPAMTTQQAA